VDDIIFGSNNEELCETFVEIMKSEFEMSMMGELNYFLGLQVKQLKDDIFLNQAKYCKDLLRKFDMNRFILTMFMIENVYINQVIVEIMQINLQATHTDINEKTVNNKTIIFNFKASD